MSRIKNKDTKPELLLRSELHKAGLRFRLHGKNLPGKPDIVLPKYKTVIFVHGCYYHRHKGCKNATMPKTNTDFWSTKFNANVERDVKNRKELKRNKWKVIVIWECEIEKDIHKVLNKIINKLSS